jgi:hypothetical protein
MQAAIQALASISQAINLSELQLLSLTWEDLKQRICDTGRFASGTPESIAREIVQLDNGLDPIVAALGGFPF